MEREKLKPQDAHNLSGKNKKGSNSFRWARRTTRIKKMEKRSTSTKSSERRLISYHNPHQERRRRRRLQHQQQQPASATNYKMMHLSGKEKPLPLDYKPRDFDVLCGRGKINANFPGNQKFTQALRSNVQSYIAASKRIDKSIVVASIVTSFRQNGARFVKFDNAEGRYYELGQEQIHYKTGHAIRDIIKNSTNTTTASGSGGAAKKKKRRRKHSTSSTTSTSKRRGGPTALKQVPPKEKVNQGQASFPYSWDKEVAGDGLPGLVVLQQLLQREEEEGFIDTPQAAAAAAPPSGGITGIGILEETKPSASTPMSTTTVIQQQQQQQQQQSGDFLSTTRPRPVATTNTTTTTINAMGMLGDDLFSRAMELSQSLIGNHNNDATMETASAVPAAATATSPMAMMTDTLTAAAATITGGGDWRPRQEATLLPGMTDNTATSFWTGAGLSLADLSPRPFAPNSSAAALRQQQQQNDDGDVRSSSDFDDDVSTSTSSSYSSSFLDYTPLPLTSDTTMMDYEDVEQVCDILSDRKD